MNEKRITFEHAPVSTTPVQGNITFRESPMATYVHKIRLPIIRYDFFIIVVRYEYLWEDVKQRAITRKVVVKSQCSNDGTSTGSIFLFVTTSCWVGLAGNDTNLSGRWVSVSEGLGREPSSLRFLWSTVGLQASTGTFVSSMSKVEETELLTHKGAIKRDNRRGDIFFIAWSRLFTNFLHTSARSIRPVVARRSAKKQKGQRSPVSNDWVVLVFVVGVGPETLPNCCC